MCISFCYKIACPTIVTRAQWGATAASTSVLPRRPAPFVVVHHTAGAFCSNRAGCDAQMRNIQHFHRNTNGWADIGYNLCVGECGNAYMGRGWDRQGAHAPGYNNQSVGICIFGNFTSRQPNAAALTALQRTINCGVGMGHIASGHWVIGHQQASATACPGTALMNHVRGMPRFNANPRPL